MKLKFDLFKIKIADIVFFIKNRKNALKQSYSIENVEKFIFFFNEFSAIYLKPIENKKFQEIYPLVFTMVLKNKLTVFILNKRDEISLEIDYFHNNPYFTEITKGSRIDYLNNFNNMNNLQISKIRFPFYSGGDGFRCLLKNYLLSRNLSINKCSGWEIITFEESCYHFGGKNSIDKEVKDLCKRCPVWNNIENPNINIKSLNSESDGIKLTKSKFNDLYIPCNGMHRICNLKKYPELLNCDFFPRDIQTLCKTYSMFVFEKLPQELSKHNISIKEYQKILFNGYDTKQVNELLIKLHKQQNKKKISLTK